MTPCIVRMSHSSSELGSGSRRLCDRLKFEEEEVFQVATMDAFVNEGWVIELQLLAISGAVSAALSATYY